MKTTFRMMGIADYITICNGLLGVMAIVFVILAVDDMKQPYSEGVLLTDYIWAAMLCILLSALSCRTMIKRPMNLSFFDTNRL